VCQATSARPPEIEGVFEAGRVAPVGLVALPGGCLAAALGVGHSAQRDDLEPAGIELGTQPGAEAPVDSEGGGEGRRQPEAHAEGVDSEPCADRGGVRVETVDHGGQVARRTDVDPGTQVDEPAGTVTQTHQSPPWTGTPVHVHVHSRVLTVPVWTK
jgi:hypothetical protein